MKPEEVNKNWDMWGNSDPLWAITTFEDKRGGAWDPFEFFETGKREIATVIERCKGLGMPKEHKKALDFGCGVGRLTQAIADHYDEVWGVDISSSMIEKARGFNKHGERCTYAVNVAFDLKQFADDSFDFVFSKAVLQHIRPPVAKGYVREFLRVLKPGGLLVFQMHSEPRVAHRAVKRRIQSILPDSWSYLYRDIKWRIFKQPTIELYGIEKHKLASFIDAIGGEVLDIQPDPTASGTWDSYMYYVTG